MQLIKGDFVRLEEELDFRERCGQRGFSEVRNHDGQSFFAAPRDSVQNPFKAGLVDRLNIGPIFSYTGEEKGPGAKAQILLTVAARLKSCPDTKNYGSGSRRT